VTAKSNSKPSKEDFAKEFILTGCKNGTQAAISAGYSEKTAAAAASRLLKDVKVLTMIDTFKKAQTKHFIKTKEQKLLDLEKIQEAAMKADPEKGMVNIPGAIAAIKEHNLMQGDNAPTQSEVLTTTQTLAEKLSGGSKR